MLGVLMGVGCAHNEPPAGHVEWRGPTEPMERVVAEVNANSSGVPSMWARHYFAGDVVDDRGKSHYVNTEGVLLMRKPASVRVVGKKPLAGTVFDLGTDGTRYWMSVPVEVDTMWWGFDRNIGKPCSRAIPIQPESMLEVLGVGEFDAGNLNQPPVPVMRFDGAADAYVFLWSRPLAGRWAATKEVWYDRVTKLPKRVQLYDGNGRVVVRAELSDHKPVEVEGRPRDRWPRVARVYHLSFPESGSKITMSLDEVLLETEGGVPNDRSFQMPDPKKAGVSKVVQIDEDCGQ